MYIVQPIFQPANISASKDSPEARSKAVQGPGFRSLTEAIDTTTPAGRMMMQMLGSFAEFERTMVRERTRAGLRAARERGRIGGRRPKLTSDQRAEIVGMLNHGRNAAEIARIFRVHRATIGRIGAEAKLDVR